MPFGYAEVPHLISATPQCEQIRVKWASTHFENALILEIVDDGTVFFVAYHNKRDGRLLLIALNLMDGRLLLIALNLMISDCIETVSRELTKMSLGSHTHCIGSRLVAL